MGELLSQSGNQLLSQDGNPLLSQDDDGNVVLLASLRLTWPPNNGGSYDLVRVKVGDTLRPWGDLVTLDGSAVDLTKTSSRTVTIPIHAAGSAGISGTGILGIQ